MIDPEELAEMRADMESTLDDQSRILRCTTANVKGSEVKTFTPDADTIPCRLVTPRNQREATTAEQVQASVDYEIKLPWGTVISHSDQIAVGTVIFDVVGDDSDRTNKTLLTVQVKRVKITS